MSDKLCDFCHTPRPEWSVPANSFTVLGGTSVGDWCACSGCALLVQMSQWDKLLARVLDSWAKLHTQPMTPVMIEILRLTYGKLQANIKGPIYKLTA